MQVAFACWSTFLTEIPPQAKNWDRPELQMIYSIITPVICVFFCQESRNDPTLPYERWETTEDTSKISQRSVTRLWTASSSTIETTSAALSPPSHLSSGEQARRRKSSGISPASLSKSIGLTSSAMYCQMRGTSITFTNNQQIWQLQQLNFVYIAVSYIQGWKNLVNHGRLLEKSQ